MTGKVSGAKGTVSDTLSTVVGKTRGVVQDGMERTKAAVSGSVNTVLDSRVVQLVSSGVDTALSTSESLVEQYLPLSEEELELEAKAEKGFDNKETSYYVRLGCLSTKLRKRAYTRAVARIQEGKERSMGVISELNSTVDLVIESRTLVLARSLTQQLQTTCLVLVSGLKGLPNHIQQEALSLSHLAAQIYSNFSRAKVLGDMPDSVLAGSRVQLGKMKESLDNVMDYLVNNTPLNWLVGPFYPRMTSHTESSVISSKQPEKRSSPLSQPQTEEPMEVEMESLHSQHQCTSDLDSEV
ncbi:hypothetical protein GOODEAATRI_019045 [Goodea atripinnis]|uniref:Perilipin n=1 Tax=Goodea atripinnis TaxID=208336 RepID=A0ABV0NLF3_9TELE